MSCSEGLPGRLLGCDGAAWGTSRGRALGCASSLNSARNEQQRSTNEQENEQRVKQEGSPPPPPLTLSISGAAFNKLLRSLSQAFKKPFLGCLARCLTRCFTRRLQCFYKVFTRDFYNVFTSNFHKGLVQDGPKTPGCSELSKMVPRRLEMTPRWP